MSTVVRAAFISSSPVYPEINTDHFTGLMSKFVDKEAKVGQEILGKMTKTSLKHCRSLAPWKQNSGLRLLHGSITSPSTTGGWLEGSGVLN